MGPMQERRNPLKTTVIIPNYNGIDYLENCLRSLENSFADKAPPLKSVSWTTDPLTAAPKWQNSFFPGHTSSASLKTEASAPP